jgi:hypothetical protein
VGVRRKALLAPHINLLFKSATEIILFCFQSDYLQKISLKILSTESKKRTQQNPQNIQVDQNQKPHGQGII